MGDMFGGPSAPVSSTLGGISDALQGVSFGAPTSAAASTTQKKELTKLEEVKDIQNKEVERREKWQEA